MGPPRSGAVVGVVTLRGAGVPLLENQKGFLVSWFLDFLCFMDFRISKIYQDPTIVKFRFLLKTLGEVNCCGPNKN